MNRFYTQSSQKYGSTQGTEGTLCLGSGVYLGRGAVYLGRVGRGVRGRGGGGGGEDTSAYGAASGGNCVYIGGRGGEGGFNLLHRSRSYSFIRPRTFISELILDRRDKLTQTVRTLFS